jgi:hypothetical protein
MEVIIVKIFNKNVLVVMLSFCLLLIAIPTSAHDDGYMHPYYGVSEAWGQVGGAGYYGDIIYGGSMTLSSEWGDACGEVAVGKVVWYGTSKIGSFDSCAQDSDYTMSFSTDPDDRFRVLAYNNKAWGTEYGKLVSVH